MDFSLISGIILKTSAGILRSILNMNISICQTIEDVTLCIVDLDTKSESKYFY